MLLLSLIACIGICWWIPRTFPFSPFASSTPASSTAMLTLMMALTGILLPLPLRAGPLPNSFFHETNLYSASFGFMVLLVFLVFILQANTCISHLSRFDFLMSTIGACMLHFLWRITPEAYLRPFDHLGILSLVIVSVLCVLTPFRNAISLLAPLTAHLAAQLLAHSSYIQDLCALGFSLSAQPHETHHFSMNPLYPRS